MSTRYTALTAYGIPIVTHLKDHAAARWWASTQARRFPGCTVVQETVAGPRVIHREPNNPEEIA